MRNRSRHTAQNSTDTINIGIIYLSINKMTINRWNCYISITKGAGIIYRDIRIPTWDRLTKQHLRISWINQRWYYRCRIRRKREFYHTNMTIWRRRRNIYHHIRFGKMRLGLQKPHLKMERPIRPSSLLYYEQGYIHLSTLPQYSSVKIDISGVETTAWIIL